MFHKKDNLGSLSVLHSSSAITFGSWWPAEVEEPPRWDNSLEQNNPPLVTLTLTVLTHEIGGVYFSRSLSFHKSEILSYIFLVPYITGKGIIRMSYCIKPP